MGDWNLYDEGYYGDEGCYHGDENREPEYTSVRGDVVQETQKAILLVIGINKHWIAKSLIEDIDTSNIEYIELTIAD